MRKLARMTTAAATAGAIPVFDRPDRITKARRYSGMSQADLAAELGVSVRSIVNYENGARVPSRAILIAWSFATGVDLDWIENGERPRPVEVEGDRSVRHQGLEPRTRWLIPCAGQDVEADVIELDSRRAVGA